MKRALIFHGMYGSPQENWIVFLRQQLEQRGYEVMTPNFPTPEHQDLSTWLTVTEPYMKDVDEETILIALSLGVATALRVLERLPATLGAVYLIAGFTQPVANPVVTQATTTFIADPFDWPQIKTKAQQFLVVQSDNDPVVDFQQGGEIARQLGCEILAVPGASHFSDQVVARQFDGLLARIDKLS